jgi:hypothetical protein
MNHDDVERLLGRLTPRVPDRGARPRLLAAVTTELTKEPDSPWTRRIAWAAAAALLVGIGLNVWVSKSSEYRLTTLFGLSPVSKEAKELAETIESVADAQTASWLSQRCAAVRASDDRGLGYEAYCDRASQLAAELSNPCKDREHETPQKDPQVDRDRHGGPSGDRSDCQRPFRFDHCFTA